MKPLYVSSCLLALGLLLTACGGGGGGGSGDAPPAPEPPPVVDNPGGCGEDGPLLACYAGTYAPRNVYLGEPAWSQLIVATDGSASFQGEEALSFAAAEVVAVEDRREADQSIVVRTGSRTYRFVVGADGTLYDVEYEQAGMPTGITVADLPAWRQSASLSHGIKGTVAGRNYAIYIDPATAEPSYADARGLHIAAFEAGGTTGWRLHIDGFAPDDFPRSYPCRAELSGTTSLEFAAPGLALSTAAPGRCRIDITYIEYLTPNDPRTPIDYIDGRFVAELQGETPSTPVRVVDGLFRFDVN